MQTWHFPETSWIFVTQTTFETEQGYPSTTGRKKGHPTRDPWWVLVPSTAVENCPGFQRPGQEKLRQTGGKYFNFQQKTKQICSFCALWKRHTKISTRNLQKKTTPKVRTLDKEICTKCWAEDCHDDLAFFLPFLQVASFKLQFGWTFGYPSSSPPLSNGWSLTTMISITTIPTPSCCCCHYSNYFYYHYQYHYQLPLPLPRQLVTTSCYCSYNYSILSFSLLSFYFLSVSPSNLCQFKNSKFVEP